MKSKKKQQDTRITAIKRYLGKNEYFPKKIDSITFRSLISKMIIIDPQNIIYVIETLNQTARDEFVIRIDDLISKKPIKKSSFTTESNTLINYRIVKL